jgi:pimeloyl-ACP methyl ester carboxylesterase
LWLTQEGANRRKAISDAAYPVAGDILLYQARGEAIRNRIQERILAAGGPVHVLAHSLGGVACVELLAMQTLPVQQLITMGSQAPFFYEINALRCLTFGDPLPDSLPSWLNIYDLKDFLSYVGGDLFPGRVVDYLVDNRQAFPASHSAYWWNPKVWDAILPTLRH